MAVALSAVGGVAWALGKDIGVPIRLEMQWPGMALVVGVCLVLAVAASVVPARLSLRAAAVPPGD